MARWTRNVGLFTLALVFVGIITAVIFKWQLDAMQGQLGVMQGQLDEMRRQERPWIAVQAPDTVGPLHYYETIGTGTIDAIFALKNVGRAPATDVSLYWYIASGFSRPELIEEKQRRVIGLGALVEGKGLVLFPNESIAKPTTYRFAQSEWPPPEFIGLNYIQLLIVGIVTYGFVASPGLHHTGFAYYVTDINGAPIKDPLVPSNASHIETLRLFRYSHAANWAD